MDSVFTAIAFATMALQAVVLLLGVNGHLRKYSSFFAYVAISLTTTALEGYYRDNKEMFRQFYWTDQVALVLILFMIVATMTYQSMPDDTKNASKMRPLAGKALFATLFFALVMPFAIFHNRVLFSDRWFRGTSQFLTFGVGLMTLVFWMALITNKKRDPILVKIALGIGVAMAGEALGWGLKQLFTHHQTYGNVFDSTTNMIGLGIWCSAFWPKRANADAQGPGTPQITDTPSETPA